MSVFLPDRQSLVSTFFFLALVSPALLDGRCSWFLVPFLLPVDLRPSLPFLFCSRLVSLAFLLEDAAENAAIALWSVSLIR